MSLIKNRVVVSFTAPSTPLCQQTLLKLTAGHFIIYLADKEAFFFFEGIVSSGGRWK